MKPKIKFSHNYPKLWNQTEARLVFLDVIDGDNLHKDLIEYDTKNTKGEYYPLPKTNLMQLVFIGNKKIPFCTLRRFTDKKWSYYCNLEGHDFDVVFPSTTDSSKES